MIKVLNAALVEQINVKNRNDTAFCNKELKFGTVIEKARKSKAVYRVKYYPS